MVRLVGADIVDKAGDVVEECFDRLDEYHGYGVIVDGLIEVLAEVVKVIEMEAEVNAGSDPESKETGSARHQQHPWMIFSRFCLVGLMNQWMKIALIMGLLPEEHGDKTSRWKALMKTTRTMCLRQ